MPFLVLVGGPWLEIQKYLNYKCIPDQCHRSHMLLYIRHERRAVSMRCVTALDQVWRVAQRP